MMGRLKPKINLNNPESPIIRKIDNPETPDNPESTCSNINSLQHCIGGKLETPWFFGVGYQDRNVSSQRSKNLKKSKAQIIQKISLGLVSFGKV